MFDRLNENEYGQFVEWLRIKCKRPKGDWENTIAMIWNKDGGKRINKCIDMFLKEKKYK